MKYNLSKIMKRAWELVKKIKLEISTALKVAWKEAKEMAKKIQFDGFTKIAREGSLQKSESDFFYFKLWKGNKTERIYIKDYKSRTIGYIDIADKTICDAYNNEVERAAERFMEEYNF